MEIVKKETIYTYKITETERVALIGILSTLDKKGELKIFDDTSKEWVKNLLNGLGK